MERGPADIASACLLTVFAFPVNAASGSAVTPRNDFRYYGTDLDSSLYSGKKYQTENAYFRDEAELFGSADYTDVCETIQNAADKIGMNVGFFIGGNYRSDNQTMEFCRDSIISLFGNDADTSSVFVYLDFEGESPSFDFICCQHDATLYYPPDGLDERQVDMRDNMYKYLPSSGSTIYTSAVINAIEAFCSDLEYYYDEGMVWETSYYNEEKGAFRYVFFGIVLEGPLPPYKYLFVFLAIGIIIGLIVAASSVSSIKKKYKFRETQNASAYTSRNRIKFNNVSDRFLREHTTRVKIESSSSHGGGGGGFGGGGSFSGTGGHR